MVSCKGALLSAAILLQLAVAQHPCSTEVASACADRPTSDIATCLKDPEEHDSPTEISSACTDFIALNKACADDIEQFCDQAGLFGDDTILCLTKWAPQDDVSDKCKGVLEWAVPQAEASEDEVVTDELGMSQADHDEKMEWRKKRAAARGDAIERMKMKEVDKKKEEDRVALEEFEKNDPEGYAQMIQQQEEEKRQQAEFKRRERAHAAAMERKRKKDAGVEEDEDESRTKGGSGKNAKPAKSKGSWLYSLMSFAVLAGVGLAIYGLVKMSSKNGGGGRKAAGSKKKRG